MTNIHLPAHGGRRYSDPTKIPNGNVVMPTLGALTMGDDYADAAFSGGNVTTVTPQWRVGTSGTWNNESNTSTSPAHFDGLFEESLHQFRLRDPASGAVSNIVSGTTVNVAVVAPTLGDPTVMSVSVVNLPYSGGSGFTTLTPQWSVAGENSWTSASAATGSPAVVTGLPDPSTSYDFRLRAQGGGDTVYSNVVTATTASTEDPTAVPILFSDFETYTMPGSWQFGAQDGGTVALSTSTASNYNGSAKSVRGVYPAHMGTDGGVFIWGLQYPGDYPGWVSSKNEVYVRFYAKMPGAKWGCKFLKVFGGDNGNGSISNCTFGLDYTGENPGSLIQVSFGDGTDPHNDTQNVIRLDGSDPDFVGRSYGQAVISTPQNDAWNDWGTGWHLFEFAVGFNSGTSSANEVADGWFIVRIDGVTYLTATNLFNRHYASPPIEKIELFGQAQGNNSSAFELMYDNVEITQGAFGSQA
jgi:hypothetical protein